jgi:hypothetical protein
MTNNEEGLLDMADIDTDRPIPAGWEPVQDELPFNAYDKDVNPDG